MAEFAAEHGNPNAASDAGVGGLLLDAAVGGAVFNIRINLGSIKDGDFVAEMCKLAGEFDEERDRRCEEVTRNVRSRIHS